MKRLLRSFAPGRWCYGCGLLMEPSEPMGICPTCVGRLPWFEEEICFYCGYAHLKGDCREDFAPDITQLKSLFYYREPVNQWVAALKYSRDLIAGRLLQQLLTQWMERQTEWLSQYDLILPVPIHHARLRMRGFNQTSYLLRQQTQLPLGSQLAKKTRYTKHQAGLSGKGRLTNLHKSFGAQGVEGLNILLFDDVCTSGQTLDQLAHCLKKEGAEEIGALSLCRSSN
ncbi:MAG: phosphoribosyltransferase family protein [bacterium]|nr:phosphoribosyltransferase family protein [bacterium]